MAITVKKAWRKPLRGIAVGLVAAALAFLLWLPGWQWFVDLENLTYDWRVAVLAAPGPHTNDIRLVLLDQNSLGWAERVQGWGWPWPREIYGVIIDYLKGQQVKSLAFDVLFTEQTTTWVEEDRKLGEAIAALGRFAAGSVVLDRIKGDTPHWPPDLPFNEIVIDGLGDWMAQTGSQRVGYPGATLPIPEIIFNAAVLCNVMHEADIGGIYRRISLFHVFDGKVFPSLGLGAYLAANPDAALKIEPGWFHVGEYRIPIDDHGHAILRFRGPSQTHRTFSAASVLQTYVQLMEGETPNIDDPDAFQSKYVFFGFSAPGLKDLRPTPVSDSYPGVEIHATFLDNLLSRDFIRPVPLWLTAALVFFVSVAGAVMISMLDRWIWSLCIGTVFSVAPVATGFFAYYQGFWLPMTVLLSAVLVSATLAQILNYAFEGRQKKFIKNAFQQYLSPAVIEQILHHPDRLKLGGERREISIFFSDLEGFTTISEGLSPEDLTALLNAYLTEMTDIILDEGGTVDKYEGDAIIAFWNAPLEVKRHAECAVRAALRCQAKLTEMRPEFKARINKELFMRIGINTGFAVVGNMGSTKRFDYTMLGDAVNLAARLEGVNKQFGTYSMISEHTRIQLVEDPSLVCRELARVAVVGKTEPVVVHEPMFRNAFELNQDIFAVFDKGLRCFYEGDFQAAAGYFRKIGALDPAARHYIEKCLTLDEQNPAQWNGVWRMTSK